VSEAPRPLSVSAVSGPSLLRLARTNREAAREQLRSLSPELQAHAYRELRHGVRSEFLMLLDNPERVLPLLPEAEVCITLRAGGMSEAAWMLEFASAAQLRACFDLDCWGTYELEQPRVLEWLDALIEAGHEVLVRAIREMDLEIWVLALQGMTDVAVLGKEEIPPDGWLTVDGVVYFGPREEDHFSRVREIALATFHGSQDHYWQLVYGVLFETPAECQEYALRWRTSRLSDLGFPGYEQAIQAYRPLQAKEAETWEHVPATGALVPSLDLPERLRGGLLGAALAALPVERATDVLGYILAVANTIAVADQLRLSDEESIPKALDKGVRGIEAGLRELARVRGQAPHEVLDRTRPLDLFRTGATLDRALRER
jgi:hypothetical protein